MEVFNEQFEVGVSDTPELESDEQLMYDDAMKMIDYVTTGDIVGTGQILSKCLMLSPLELDMVIKKLSGKVGNGVKALKSEFQSIKNKADKEANPGGNTHASYAQQLMEGMSAPVKGKKYPPIGSRGVIYNFDVEQGIWLKNERLIRPIIAKFDGQERCKTKSDYEGIFKVAYDLNRNEEFFGDAPAGLAAPNKFYSVDDGKISSVPLGPEHRQTALCPVEPQKIPIPLWEKHLLETFGVFEEINGVHTLNQKKTDEQINSFQESAGAIAIRYLHKFHKVVLILGPGRNGKGVLLKVLEAIFPSQEVGCIPPYEWSNEVSCSSMSQLSVNIVGDLNKTSALPDGDFKNITGGDKAKCRNLYQMPFSVVITAGHIFAGQYYPHTKDRSIGFWERWVLFRAPTTVPEASRDPNLSDRIIKTELAGIAHWLLEGARRCVKRGRIVQSAVHSDMLQEWKRKHTPVLAFLTECARVKVGKDERCSRTQLYETYRDWCVSVGRKPENSTNFYDELVHAGYSVTGKFGKRPKDGGKDTRVKGVVGVGLSQERGSEGVLSEDRY